jgi:hypothetical protein
MRASPLPTAPTNSTATFPEHYPDTRYEVSHISSRYYLLMFNSHLTDKDFKAFAKTLTLIGYISFLWSPAAKSEEHSLSYKVWLDLVDLPPHLWSFDELAVLTSSFGLILAHSSLNKVASFERLWLSIATDALSKIPRAICLFLNGRMSHIPVVVTGWIRETMAFEALKDYTSSDNIYATMAASLHGRIALSNARRSSAPSTSELPGPQPLQTDNPPTTNPPVQLSPSTSVEQPPVGSASTTVSVDHHLLLDLCTRAPASSAKQVLPSVLQVDKHCSVNPNSFQKNYTGHLQCCPNCR